jgi:hypothetical protein
MGFWSKLFGKKDDAAKTDDTMANPAAPAEEAAEKPEETTEETAE